jgi:hypothetical protein
MPLVSDRRCDGHRVALGLAAAHPGPAEADNDARVRRVLLISIDGMHSVDFINCANGISGANGGKPYCPNLAGFKATSVNYLDASTSNDYYSPEINSIPVPLPGVKVSSNISCRPNLPDQTAVSSSNAWTDSFQNIQCYDTLKGQRDPQSDQRQDA